jgi:rhamnose utilization protein RhaD (predicted bifunctional aldolase and dehydrogenase)
MKKNFQPTAEFIKKYCTKISADPLLVQGAGGNISWKDGDVLWVKASGTWLANAEKDDIFVPVDLVHLRTEMAEGKFTATPKIVSDVSLKPSIETMLHALMPHKIVIHLHPVEILAHLVREDPLVDLQKLVGNTVKWIFVDYIKPGAELAQAICAKLDMYQDVDVLFLRSHGLVIGGGSIDSIDFTLCKLLLNLKNKSRKFENNISSETLDINALHGLYAQSADLNLNQLATNAELLNRVKNDWALYPDHIVFLGEKAFIVTDANDLIDLSKHTTGSPNFIFICGKGVYENRLTTPAHRAQLLCYYEVLTRQSKFENLVSLNNFQVAELLDWDSEKYRQNIVATVDLRGLG